MTSFLRFILSRYGLFGSFVLIFVENIGIPLPTEVVYVLAESLIVRGTYSYLVVTIIFLAAHILGSICAYALGRGIAQGMQNGKKMSAIQEKIAGWYKKHGILAVFFARLIGQVRPWSSYVAGAAEMEFWPFVIVTTLGSAVFNAVSLALTSVIFRYAGHHHWFAILSGILFFGGIAAVILIEGHHHITKKRK